MSVGYAIAGCPQIAHNLFATVTDISVIISDGPMKVTDALARPSDSKISAIGTPWAYTIDAPECRGSWGPDLLHLRLAAQFPPEVAERVGTNSPSCHQACAEQPWPGELVTR